MEQNYIKYIMMEYRMCLYLEHLLTFIFWNYILFERHGTLEADLDSMYMRRLLVFVMTAI